MGVGLKIYTLVVFYLLTKNMEFMTNKLKTDWYRQDPYSHFLRQKNGKLLMKDTFYPDSFVQSFMVDLRYTNKKHSQYFTWEYNTRRY